MLCAFALFACAAANAAETHVILTLDGRPISTRPSMALMRDGVLFVDAVDITRIFDGLLVFEHNGVRLGLRGHNESFTIGRHVVLVDKTAVRVHAAPFEYNGDIFVPIDPIIGADPALRLTWINQHHADLHVTAF